MKIPADVYKKIKALAQQLPVIPQLTKDGRRVYRAVGKAERVLGKNLPKDTQVQGTVEPDKQYWLQHREQVMMNHEVNLCQAYQADGLNGIESYKVWCEQVELEREKIRKRLEVLKNKGTEGPAPLKIVSKQEEDGTPT